MSVEEPTAIAPAVKTAYGRLVRERGTLRIVLGVIGIALLWYVYDSVQTARMIAQQWPQLSADKAGLTVLGLRDKDRPGWRHKYEAREANHAWQIRRPDEAESEGSDGDEVAPDKGSRAGKVPGVSDPKVAGADERHAPGSITQRSASGSIVPLDEVMANCPVVMVGRNFTDASIEKCFEPFMGADYYKVNLGLTPEGRARYWQFSRDRDRERLAFVLQGELFTCAEMRNMDVSSITISPIWVKSDAERLAKFINGQK